MRLSRLAGDGAGICSTLASEAIERPPAPERQVATMTGASDVSAKWADAEEREGMKEQVRGDS